MCPSCTLLPYDAKGLTPHLHLNLSREGVEAGPLKVVLLASTCPFPSGCPRASISLCLLCVPIIRGTVEAQGGEKQEVEDLERLGVPFCR